MRRIREALQRIKALFRSDTIARGIDAELDQHLEMMVADFIADGMSPEEARAAARREFGNLGQLKEETRDSWGTRAVLDTVRNFRFGLRLSARYPSSTVLAVVVLSLGVAIATVMFTLSIKLMNGTAGAELDDRDVAIEWAIGPERRARINTRDFAILRNDVQSLQYLVGVQNSTFWFHQPDQPDAGKQYRGVLATPTLFTQARSHPIRGRVFGAEDVQPSAERVIVISNAVWSEIYDRDEAALGSVAKVDGQDHRIIGIMPEGFAFPGEQQLWLPAEWRMADGSPVADLPAVSVAGRLKPGVTREQAQAELETIAANLAAAFPTDGQDQRQLIVTPYRDKFIDDDALTFLILGLFGSILVLSLSCANSFQVIMARTALRSHELAVRCSLGAKRSHVLAQVIVDGLTLSGIGTAVGLGIAAVGLHFITHSLKIFGMPGLHTFQLQPDIVLFAVVAGVIAGVASSIVPAWRASRLDSFTILKDDSKSSSSIFVGTLAKIMVVAQVTFSSILLFLSLMLLMPTMLVDSLVMSYDEDSVLTAIVQLRPDPQFDSPEAIDRFYQQLHQRINAVPGVRAMALSSAKMGMFGDLQSIEVEGIATNTALTMNQGTVSSVTPDFLDVFELEPVSGRMLNAFDTRDSLPVCVVDERFAATYFPQESPIGKRVNVDPRSERPEWVTIVGVIPSVRPTLPLPIEKELGPILNEILRPYAQTPSLSPTILLSAPEASAYTYRQAIRESLRDFAPRARIDGSILTVQQRFDFVTRLGDSIAIAGMLFGGAIFLVSIIGLYSTISFTTAQRRKEFGIRMAVGASAWGIAKSVMKPWAVLVGTGLVLGAFCTLGLVVLQTAATGAQTTGSQTDLVGFSLSFLGVVLTICVSSLIAAGLPAWRATKVNPIDVIRNE